MPTYERSPQFIRDYNELRPDQKAAFTDAVSKFVADLQRGRGFRPGRRVKEIKGAPGFYELTWAPDGQAVFSDGDSIREGEPHIIWLAVGTHEVLPS